MRDQTKNHSQPSYFPQPSETQLPLVSIMLFCKNSSSTIRRCAESVLGQSYRNIEFLVQDGASTDGTVDILRSYGDERIKIVSERDSGPGEAFWKVLNRCEGDFIGTCLADEELLPNAIHEAVERFRQHPDVGAITGDGYVTDLDGKITGDFIAGDFNIVDYLFGRYCPLWPSSFFRRQALLDVGLKTHKWTIECLEFEIWCRLGTQHVVKYFPGRVAKYGVHPTQLSNTARHFTEHYDHRAVVIRQMFSDNGFFGSDEMKLNGCLYNQLYVLYAHVTAYRLNNQVDRLASGLREIRNRVSGPIRINYFPYFNFVANSLSSGQDYETLVHVCRRANSIWTWVALSMPTWMRSPIPRRAKGAMRTLLTATVYVLFHTGHALRHVIKHAETAARGERLSELYTPEFSPRIYHEVAQLYYARGQISQAVALWRRAEVLNDPTIDGLACQAMLMLPEATSSSLADAQKRWALRHAKPIADLQPLTPQPYDGRRPIRVGYFCAFFDSHVFRSQLGQVLKQQDRQRFKIFGYSVTPVAGDIRKLFDDFKVTGVIPDHEFIGVVRKDQLDICVELTGFSPSNRFPAMASRCAPIQMSYLNHTGTTGVPNLDYVIADQICGPENSAEDGFFTERVLRLPGCFFCFNYDWDGVPPVSSPPFDRNGFVRFGTFASGGKINDYVIELWAGILNCVPRAKLLIGNHQLSSSCNRDYMEARFKRHGIDSQRLELMGGMQRRMALRWYDNIDISLDTWPYCGGNSVAEPIWQGVPVITLKGNRFSSRYGASLVTAAGCPELVATSPGEYVDIAVKLATEPDRLRHYRANLRGMSLDHGLSDAKAFAAKLHSAYLAAMDDLHVIPAAALATA
jgi:predicted O-linked N-acetylglucosamine transferase (SPINDLY family)/glycosyltransferase involved in cell wall biosynthesis